jgi:hypothetical protein
MPVAGIPGVVARCRLGSLKMIRGGMIMTNGAVVASFCEDDVPTILFRGQGKAMQQASFHWSCFKQVARFKSSAADA